MSKIVSEYDQEVPQSQTADNNPGNSNACVNIITIALRQGGQFHIYVGLSLFLGGWVQKILNIDIFCDLQKKLAFWGV